MSLPLLENSLQSSCLQLLTNAQLFTQANFPTRLETVRVRVPHGPTPPISRCSPAPQFLWCRCPQSQRMCTTSVCLPLHLYSLQWLQASRYILVQLHPPCLAGEGAVDLTLIQGSCSRHWARGCRSTAPHAGPRDLTVPTQSPYCLLFNVLYNFGL